MTGSSAERSLLDVKSTLARWVADRIDDQAAIDALHETLRSDDAVVRKFALKYLVTVRDLSEYPPIEIVEDIAAAAKDGNRLLVAQADDLRVLFHQEPTALTPLVPHFQAVLSEADVPADTNPYIVCWIIGEIGSIAPGAVNDLLPSLVKAVDSDERMTSHAVSALNRIGRTEPAVIRPLIAGHVWNLDAELPEVIAEACADLGRIGLVFPDMVPATADLEELLEHRDPAVRRRAVEAIGRIGGVEPNDDGHFGQSDLGSVENSYDAVAALVSDPNDEVHEAAVVTIRRLCAVDPALISCFRSELVDAIQENRGATTEAAVTLRRAIDGGESVPTVIEPLRRALGTCRSHREEIAQTLCAAIEQGLAGQLGGRHAVGLACWALLERPGQSSKIDDPAVVTVANAVEALGIEDEFLEQLLANGHVSSSSTRRTIGLLIARLGPAVPESASEIIAHFHRLFRGDTQNEPKTALLGLRFIAGTDPTFDRAILAVVEDYLNEGYETGMQIAAEAAVAAADPEPADIEPLLADCCRIIKTAAEEDSRSGANELLRSISEDVPEAVPAIRSSLLELVTAGGTTGVTGAAVLIAALDAKTVSLSAADRNRLREALDADKESIQYRGAVAAVLLRADTDQPTAQFEKDRLVESVRLESSEVVGSPELLDNDPELAAKTAKKFRSLIWMIPGDLAPQSVYILLAQSRLSASYRERLGSSLDTLETTLNCQR